MRRSWFARGAAPPAAPRVFLRCFHFETSIKIRFDASHVVVGCRDVIDGAQRKRVPRSSALVRRTSLIWGKSPERWRQLGAETQRPPPISGENPAARSRSNRRTDVRHPDSTSAKEATPARCAWCARALCRYWPVRGSGPPTSSLPALSGSREAARLLCDAELGLLRSPAARGYGHAAPRHVLAKASRVERLFVRVGDGSFEGSASR